MNSLSLRESVQLSLQKRSVVLFSQVLETASRGHLLVWGRTARLHGGFAPTRFETKLRDSQVMAEFKSKLRTAEDLIAKLGYSLREITRDH